MKVLVAAQEAGHQDVIRHASLHAHSGSPARVGGRGPERLRDQMLHMVEDGWRLQRLVSLIDYEHLKVQLDVAGRFMQAAHNAGKGGGIVMRAVVGDLLPTMVPLIVGDYVACLGVDNLHSNIAERTIVLNGRDTVAVLVAHFDDLWQDRRALRIWDASGPVPEGIAAARRALERRQSSAQ